MFKEIWNERPHKSELSGIYLPYFNVSNFAHLLNKGYYSSERLNKDNIMLLTFEEHNLLDAGTIAQREAYAKRMKCDWSVVYDKKEKLKQVYNQNR